MPVLPRRGAAPRSARACGVQGVWHTPSWRLLGYHRQVRSAAPANVETKGSTNMPDNSVAESPRMRRLRADHQRMVELNARSDLIDVQTFGSPPERYIVTYHVPSVIGV